MRESVASESDAASQVPEAPDELERESERARLLREARSARERLHVLFRETPAAIAILEGQEHVFAFANRGYEDLVGRPAEALIGRRVRDAIPEADAQGLIHLLDGVHASGQAFRAEGMPVEIERDGVTERRYLDFVLQPVRSQGDIDAIIAHVIDVTPQVVAQEEMRRLTAELELRVAERTRALTEANRELREANDVLTSFASVISHDLKEPVRALETYVSAAIEEYGTPEGRAFLAKALQANRRQQKLIQGLLAYSDISAQPVAIERVDLDRIVREEARGYFEQIARERRAQVLVEGLPPVSGTPVLLTQLFGNIILNALRHNLSASPRVRVHAERRDDEVEVFVDDNGPGFAPEVRAQVESLRAASAGTVKGGFGLTIAVRAAQRVGGRIELLGAPGGGARVRVVLPAADEV